MSKEGIQINRLLNEQQMNGKVGLFAHVTIAPGAVLDDHTHHGETETYHILAGEGVYRDNGTDCPAKPGDTFFMASAASARRRWNLWRSSSRHNKTLPLRAVGGLFSA